MHIWFNMRSYRVYQMGFAKFVEVAIWCCAIYIEWGCNCMHSLYFQQTLEAPISMLSDKMCTVHFQKPGNYGKSTLLHNAHAQNATTPIDTNVLFVQFSLFFLQSVEVVLQSEQFEI